MYRTGSRRIKVKKEKLIATIIKNRDAHILEYNEAVIAYKLTAIAKLNSLLEDAEDGGLNLKLGLTSPVNNVSNYNKLIDIFTWEIESEVELSQDEFKEYIQDETSFTETAKFSNSMYLGQ